jgi:hypothetical protein
MTPITASRARIDRSDCGHPARYGQIRLRTRNPPITVPTKTTMLRALFIVNPESRNSPLAEGHERTKNADADTKGGPVEGTHSQPLVFKCANVPREGLTLPAL